MTRTRIVVLGGANTDVVGRSDVALVARDSNPGTVLPSSGGVGRNIAENLSRIGIETTLVTAFGGDHNARELIRHCEEVGIDLAPALVCEDLPGSVYLAILDPEGDMALAVSDMRPLDRLTAGFLAGVSGALEGADLIVCDANLPETSLMWLAENAPAPLVLDPVSVAKAVRARSILGSVAVVKCNAAEAAVLLSDSCPAGADAGALALALVSAGVAGAIVTDGARGVFAADAAHSAALPAPAARVVNATGAGDAFTAGVAATIARGGGILEAARAGTAMAAFTLGCAETVCPHLDASTVATIQEEIS